MTETDSQDDPPDCSQNETARRGFTRTQGVLALLFLVLLGGGVAFRNELTARLHLFAARTRASSVHLGAAEESVRFALNLEPENPATLLMLSRILHLQERVVEATRILEAARRLGASERQIHVEESLIAARVGTVPAADATLRRLMSESDVDRRTAFACRVSGFCRFGRYDRASEILDEWEAEWPDDYRLSAFRGDVARGRENWAQAIQFYKDAIEAGDPRTATKLNCVRCSLRNSELELSQRILDPILSRNPEGFAALLLRAKLELAMQNREAAASLLTKCLESRLTSYRAALMLAALHLEDDAPQEAIDLLKEHLAHWPDDIALLEMQAEALQRLGRRDELAVIRVRQQESEDAVEEIDQLKEQVSNGSAGLAEHLRLGQLLMEYQSRPEAVRHLAMVLRSNGNVVAAHDLMVRYYSAMKNTDQAFMHTMAADAIRHFGAYGEVVQ